MNNPTPYQITLPGFEGPVTGLFEQVRQRQIEIMEVPLAEVTAAYVAYLEHHEEPDLGEVGEFLRAAAVLVALKSERLLPLPAASALEKDEETERIPRERMPWSAAAQVLAERTGMESVAGLPRTRMVERMVRPADVSLLRRTWLEMRARHERLVRVAAPAFVRLEVALSGLIRRLRSGSRLAFSQVLRGANRNDAVVHFLALLELIRRRQATAEQPELFDEITVEWVENEAARQSRAG